MTKISGETTITVLELGEAQLFRVPPGDGTQTTLRIDGGGADTHVRFGYDSSVIATADDEALGPAPNAVPGNEWTFAEGVPLFIGRF